VGGPISTLRGVGEIQSDKPSAAYFTNELVP
jgi:hypothetical protein